MNKINLLHERDQLILGVIQSDGPKSAKELSDITGIPYQTVYRRVSVLEKRHQLAIDIKLTASNPYGAKVYSLPEKTHSGARIVANGKNMSFHKFASLCSKHPSYTQTDWEKVWAVIADLEESAAVLIDGDAIVKDSTLLRMRKEVAEVRDRAMNFADVLDQLVNNEKLWNSKTLKDEIAIKTDMNLSKEEMLEMSRTIKAKIGVVS